MKRTLTLAGLLIAGLAASRCHAGGYYYAARSYYVVPPPVYVAPVIAPAPIFVYERPAPVYLAPPPPAGYFYPLPKVTTRASRWPAGARYKYEVEVPGGPEYEVEYRRGLLGGRWRVRIDD